MLHPQATVVLFESSGQKKKKLPPRRTANLKLQEVVVLSNSLDFASRLLNFGSQFCSELRDKLAIALHGLRLRLYFEGLFLGYTVHAPQPTERTLFTTRIRVGSTHHCTTTSTSTILVLTQRIVHCMHAHGTHTHTCTPEGGGLPTHPHTSSLA